MFVHQVVEMFGHLLTGKCFGFDGRLKFHSAAEVDHLKHVKAHTAMHLLKNVHAPDQMRFAVFDREHGLSFSTQEFEPQFIGQFLKTSCGIFRMLCMNRRNRAQPMAISMPLLLFQKL